MQNSRQQPLTVSGWPELAARRVRTGRPPEHRGALAPTFNAKAILNLPTTRALIDHPRVDAGLRQLCDWRTLAALCEGRSSDKDSTTTPTRRTSPAVIFFVRLPQAENKAPKGGCFSTVGPSKGEAGGKSPVCLDARASFEGPPLDSHGRVAVFCALPHAGQSTMPVCRRAGPDFGTALR